MNFKITAYGHPLLRKISEDIDENYPDLKELIEEMFKTMEDSSGIGLAAPQIGKSISLFIVNSTIDENNKNKIKKSFINPEIIETFGKNYAFEEGCLSLPGIRENVVRKEKVTINYLDENFKEHEETFDGINARVILHEYDHLEGILFTDRLSSLKRKMLSRQLQNIKKGNVDVDYPMDFYTKGKGI